MTGPAVLPRRAAVIVFLAFAFAYFLSALVRAVTATLAPTLAQEFSLRVTLIEAAFTALATAREESRPAANPTVSQAVKQSPAPTVSTVRTFGAGIVIWPLRSTSRAPRDPRVTTTCRQPRFTRVRAAAIGSRCPVSSAASDSFGVKVSTRRKSLPGSFLAGAGLRMNGRP